MLSNFGGSEIVCKLWALRQNLDLTWIFCASIDVRFALSFCSALHTHGRQHYDLILSLALVNASTEHRLDHVVFCAIILIDTGSNYCLSCDHG
jgi:hypothetical protein